VCRECGIRDLLGVVVDSSRVGACKPDPAIFQTALRALAASPTATLFVGDSLPRDMAGARALGMPHVWLAGPGADGQPCCPGDPVIPSLPALERLLR
jgi:putative hydrolase of the HAD superfamily